MWGWGECGKWVCFVCVCVGLFVRSGGEGVEVVFWSVWRGRVVCVVGGGFYLFVDRGRVVEGGCEMGRFVFVLVICFVCFFIDDFCF